MTDLYDIVVAGILQGLLEWFPISSSGQVMLFLSGLLGIGIIEAYGLSIYLHFGTLLSAITFYRKDIVNVLKVVTSKTGFWNNSILRLWVIVAPISIAVGYPLYIVYRKFLGDLPLDTVTGLIGLLLVATGIALMITGSKSGSRKLEDMTLKDYVSLGVVQGLSVIPGVSRSGVTIATLLFLGLRGSEAVRTSFLASIPIIALASMYSGLVHGYVLTITGILGVLSSLLAGITGIWIMTFISRRLPLHYFSLTIGLIMVLATLPFMFF